MSKVKCKKKIYTTKEKAWGALYLVNKTGYLSVKLIKVYRCAKCKGWHLTSGSKQYKKHRTIERIYAFGKEKDKIDEKT